MGGFLLLTCACVGGQRVAADEEQARPLGDSYLPAELVALDRALEHANLVREDLAFRKHMAQGHGALPRTLTALADPMLIAPWIDELARAWSAEPAGWSPRTGIATLRDALGGSATRGHEPQRFEDPPTSPTALAARLEAVLALSERLDPIVARIAGSDLEAKALRHALPGAMAWHEVFPPPYVGSDEEPAIKALLGAADDAWLHERLMELDLAALAALWEEAFVPLLAWSAPDEGTPFHDAFPKDAPLIVDSPYGRIGIGTFADDEWVGDFSAIVDPGGNDRYRDGRMGAAFGVPGRRVGLLVDLGGHDRYECDDVPIALGAAVLGIACLLDRGGGNDRYEGGDGSLGAAMGGVAVLFDEGGSDTYSGRTFTQGAAGFGLGLLLDGTPGPGPTVSADEGTKDPVELATFDNDRLSAWCSAQAFARCRGVALCVNARGNDTYEAGGVYLHAPLFADRYQSFSQGFAIGERGVDYAGGLAFLLDGEGNDRYLGDIYNQGVGYWYGAGFLCDLGGNDLYEMTQYGQGSGIHLAIGGLIDANGNDAYLMHSGLGQGGSHDYAGSILHDRGGNDRYLGNTSCNGCGLTNSVGIHIDRAGDDLYAARRDGGINVGRAARGFGSIGVLLDLAGKDDYPGSTDMTDDSLWKQADVGVGLDLAPSEGEAPAGTPQLDHDAGSVEIPAICRTEGPLDQATFDELWKIAIRWEVGENRRIVPVARARLSAFGAPLLPYLDGAFAKRAGGLEIRAYVDVLRALLAGEAREGALDLLRSNLASADEVRAVAALQTIGELGEKALESEVAALLAHPDEARARRAAGTLARIGSEAGQETLLDWLAPARDERTIGAALDALVGTSAPIEAALRVLLGDSRFDVRGRLVALLAKHYPLHATWIEADLADNDLEPRRLRTLLDIVARAAPQQSQSLGTTLAQLAGHPDPGVRRDASTLQTSPGTPR